MCLIKILSVNPTESVDGVLSYPRLTKRYLYVFTDHVLLYDCLLKGFNVFALSLTELC